MLFPLAWAAAAAGLTLSFFGPLSDRLNKPGEVWRGFHDEGPVLLVVRAERIEKQDCSAWTDAISTHRDGAELGAHPDEATWMKAWRQWEPWSKDDQKGIEKCDDFPCAVKLNEAETKKMKAALEPERMAKFLTLVMARANRYAATQERKEYEFPGDPVDPWALFEKWGFKSSAPLPKDPALIARQLIFNESGTRVLHQIADWRTAVAPSKQEATAWVRDTYTDHFFDSWGEWHDVRCEPESKSVLVVQALILEFDLLKKTDLISRLGRGQMRSGAERNGNEYLDRQFLAIKTKALNKK